MYVCKCLHCQRQYIEYTGECRSCGGVEFEDLRSFPFRDVVEASISSTSTCCIVRDVATADYDTYRWVGRRYKELRNA